MYQILRKLLLSCLVVGLTLTPLPSLGQVGVTVTKVTTKDDLPAASFQLYGFTPEYKTLPLPVIFNDNGDTLLGIRVISKVDEECVAFVGIDTAGILKGNLMPIFQFDVIGGEPHDIQGPLPVSSPDGKTHVYTYLIICGDDQKHVLFSSRYNVTIPAGVAS